MGPTSEWLSGRATIESEVSVLRFALFLISACAALAAENRVLVDRVGTTGFVQLEAESFKKLSPREQALTYWLAQASVAIDPINYDQNSAFGLRQ